MYKQNDSNAHMLAVAATTNTARKNRSIIQLLL